MVIRICPIFAENFRWMKKWLLLAVLVLATVLAIFVQQYRNADEKWKTAEANVKAYSDMLSKEESKSTALQLTVSQLESFQDSVLMELDATRKELKVKDSKIKALQYVASTFSRKDTIILTDTIFAKPEFKLDTLLGNEWYSLELGLQYPSRIAVNPEFRSRKHIVVSSRKETVNPPSKLFFVRWFQKKHIVLNVNVVEKNPYVEEEDSRYVEIIR